MINTVPEFPKFRLFSFDDIDWYKKYYLDNKINPYVDLNYANLLVWLNMNNDLAISQLDDIFIIRYTNVLGNNKINFIPLGNQIDNNVLNKIMLYLQENNLNDNMHEVPSTICKSLNRDKWDIQDDRDSFEYILDTAQQSELEGNNFYHRRRNIRNFEKKYQDDYIKVEYFDKYDDEIKGIFIKHINNHPFTSNSDSAAKNRAEPLAINSNLKYSNLFEKKAMIITIDNVVVSVAMFSYLDDKVAAINHIKVNYDITDIFLYTIYRLAKILKELGINEMNMEQDLGLDGLRRYKERLQPSHLLEKVTIRPKTQ